jgi:hypothetical protein
LPYAPQRRNNTVFVVLAIVGAFALIAGGAVYVLRDTTHSPPHPKEWDPRVLDIVQFDEQHRGLNFKQPVFVDFLDAKAYSDRARTDESQLTDKDKQQLTAFDGEFRALGLSNTNINLLDEVNKLQDTGTLAFYDPETERVVIRGTELTVDLKVTLVHEFVHVLQDQHFGVGQKRTSKFKTSQESSSFRTIVEGDAVRIENEYIDSLSADDKAQYEQAHQQEVDSATQGLSDVPVSLQALQAAPYYFGPPLVELLQADGSQREVDDAFKTPPTTDEQVLDPPKFLHRETALDVKEPALPDGVSKDSVVDHGDFGSLSWLFVLAERIDPIVALQAVDGWGGDAYVAYTQNDRTCVRLEWQGDTTTDDEEMHAALDQWVAAMPAGVASVTASDGLLHVQACDPGADSGLTLNNRALDVLQLPSTRTALALDAVKNGGLPVDKAFEFGDCFVRTLGFDQLVAANKGGVTPEVQSMLKNVATDCSSKVGG